MKVFLRFHNNIKVLFLPEMVTLLHVSVLHSDQKTLPHQSTSRSFKILLMTANRRILLLLFVNYNCRNFQECIVSFLFFFYSTVICVLNRRGIKIKLLIMKGSFKEIDFRDTSLLFLLVNESIF